MFKVFDLDEILSGVLDLYFSSSEYTSMLLFNQNLEHKKISIQLNEDYINTYGLREINFKFISDKSRYTVDRDVFFRYKNLYIYDIRLIGSIDLLFVFREYVEASEHPVMFNITNYKFRIDLDKVTGFLLEDLCIENIKSNHTKLFSALLKEDMVVNYVSSKYKLRNLVEFMDGVTVKTDEICIFVESVDAHDLIHSLFFNTYALISYDEKMFRILHNVFDRLEIDFNVKVLYENIRDKIQHLDRLIYSTKNLLEKYNVYIKVYVDNQMYLRTDEIRFLKDNLGDRFVLVNRSSYARQ